jgi:hypothetical protein
MLLSWQEALANVRANGEAARYPDKTNARFRKTVQFPVVRPKFKIDPTDTIFTIGSCFARNIEEKLQGYTVPTRAYSVPKEEWPNRPNGVLNEYNTGTMGQRLLAAFNEESFATSERYLETIVPEGNGYVDLMLLGGVAPTTKERVIERRAEIDALYQQCTKADVVIITLGFIEAWQDTKTGLFLNRMPPAAMAKKEPDRYVFRRLDVFDSYPPIFDAIKRMTENGIQKIIITVSPVPIQTTFTKEDALTANLFSKSVLRVCAQRLYDTFPNVDYYPSYEMIMLGGSVNYIDDNVHVRDDVVQKVTETMLRTYTAV